MAPRTSGGVTCACSRNSASNIRATRGALATISAPRPSPYHPLHGIGEHRRGHPWREPDPEMILQAVAELGLEPGRCAIAGDQVSDVEAHAATGLGLRTLLARSPGNARECIPPRNGRRPQRSACAAAVSLCADGGRSALRTCSRLRRFQLLNLPPPSAITIGDAPAQ
jgi:beta-phosphoglucomutase-like phosphatase (HAD superfamily)